VFIFFLPPEYVTQYPLVAFHTILPVQSQRLYLFPSPKASDQTAADPLRLTSLENNGRA